MHPQGQVVDLYVPRKCSATNRLIIAKDHASVQINVAEVDESGKMTGSNLTYAFCGSVRETGDADDSLNRCVPLLSLPLRLSCNGALTLRFPSVQARDQRRPCVPAPSSSPFPPPSRPAVLAPVPDLAPLLLRAPAVLKNVWQY